DSALTQRRIDLLRHDIHPSTQKDAASNPGRFNEHLWSL
ncbi:hypothetical protein ABIB54_003487, partial [Frigoribacterium sp. UYMn621]